MSRDLRYLKNAPLVGEKTIEQKRYIASMHQGSYYDPHFCDCDVCIEVTALDAKELFDEEEEM